MDADKMDLIEDAYVTMIFVVNTLREKANNKAVETKKFVEEVIEDLFYGMGYKDIYDNVL